MKSFPTFCFPILELVSEVVHRPFCYQIELLGAEQYSESFHIQQDMIENMHQYRSFDLVNKIIWLLRRVEHSYPGITVQPDTARQCLRVTYF